MRVLIVEDEPKAASFVQKALADEGMEAVVVHDGKEGENLILGSPFDAVVLDIMLPGKDGLSVLKSIRDQGKRTPVLLLSARGEADERVAGLNAGADDYLAKPYVLAELIARVRAISRRGMEAHAAVLRVSDLTLDTVSREVRRGGRKLDLAQREYLLLLFLMRNAGRICGRMMILEKVWEYNFDPGTNIVDVYIMRLRKKVDEGFAQQLVRTERGVGYMIAEPSPSDHPVPSATIHS